MNDRNYNKDISLAEYLKRFNLVMQEPDEHTKVLTEFIGRELEDIQEDFPNCRIIKIDTNTSANIVIEIEEESGTKTLCLESAKCVQAFFFPNT